MFFSAQNLIGIDVGSYSIKIVKLGGDREKGYTLESASYVRVPHGFDAMGGADGAGILSEIIKTQKIRTRKAATFVKGGSLVFRHLYLPDMPQKDLKEAVRWEMRKDIIFSPDELIVDYVLTGSRNAENNLSLIAFASRKTEAEELINRLKKASLEVKVIDSLPTALLSAFDMNGMWEKGVNYAMLDMGMTETTLVVFKDMGLRFVRVIPFGGRDMTLAITNALGISDVDAENDKLSYGLEGGEEGRGKSVKELLLLSMEGLSSEITRSFDYYSAQFREGAIAKLFLCGGTAGLHGIDHYFGNLVGIPCFVDDPLRSVNIAHGFNMDALMPHIPSLTPATGLATRR